MTWLIPLSCLYPEYESFVRSWLANLARVSLAKAGNREYVSTGTFKAYTMYNLYKIQSEINIIIIIIIPLGAI